MVAVGAGSKRPGWVGERVVSTRSIFSSASYGLQSPQPDAASAGRHQQTCR